MSEEKSFHTYYDGLLVVEPPRYRLLFWGMAGKLLYVPMPYMYYLNVPYPNSDKWHLSRILASHEPWKEGKDLVNVFLPNVDRDGYICYGSAESLSKTPETTSTGFWQSTFNAEIENFYLHPIYTHFVSKLPPLEQEDDWCCNACMFEESIDEVLTYWETLSLDDILDLYRKPFNPSFVLRYETFIAWVKRIQNEHQDFFQKSFIG